MFPNATEEALALATKTLCYEPENRLTALQCCAHPFFDALRDSSTRLPNGNPLPPLLNFTTEGM
jgi:glycogen synthase kinase 3 beta